MVPCIDRDIVMASKSAQQNVKLREDIVLSFRKQSQVLDMYT